MKPFMVTMFALALSASCKRHTPSDASDVKHALAPDLMNCEGAAIRRVHQPFLNYCFSGSTDDHDALERIANDLDSGVRTWMAALANTAPQTMQGAVLAPSCATADLRVIINAAGFRANAGCGQMNLAVDSSSTTVLHELGHIFGLNDTYVEGGHGTCQPGQPRAVMCSHREFGGRLATDDESGIRAAYGLAMGDLLRPEPARRRIEASLGRLNGYLNGCRVELSEIGRANEYRLRTTFNVAATTGSARAVVSDFNWNMAADDAANLDSLLLSASAMLSACRAPEELTRRANEIATLANRHLQGCSLTAHGIPSFPTVEFATTYLQFRVDRPNAAAQNAGQFILVPVTPEDTPRQVVDDIVLRVFRTQNIECANNWTPLRDEEDPSRITVATATVRGRFREPGAIALYRIRLQERETVSIEAGSGRLRFYTYNGDADLDYFARNAPITRFLRGLLAAGPDATVAEVRSALLVVRDEGGAGGDFELTVNGRRAGIDGMAGVRVEIGASVEGEVGATGNTIRSYKFLIERRGRYVFRVAGALPAERLKVLGPDDEGEILTTDFTSEEGSIVIRRDFEQGAYRVVFRIIREGGQGRRFTASISAEE